MKEKMFLLVGTFPYKGLLETFMRSDQLGVSPSIPKEVLDSMFTVMFRCKPKHGWAGEVLFGLSSIKDIVMSEDSKTLTFIQNHNNQDTWTWEIKILDNNSWEGKCTPLTGSPTPYKVRGYIIPVDREFFTKP